MAAPTAASSTAAPMEDLLDQRLFVTFDDAYKAIKDHQYQRGFVATSKSVSTNRQGQKRGYICCQRSGEYRPWAHNAGKKKSSTKKSACPFSVYISFSRATGTYAVRVKHQEHNHEPLSELRANSRYRLDSQRHFGPEIYRLVESLSKENKTLQQIARCIGEAHPEISIHFRDVSFIRKQLRLGRVPACPPAQPSTEVIRRNPSAPSHRPLRSGIYAPTMTFFEPATEDLDMVSIKTHAQRLVRAGLVGLVAMGSYGEAVHCTRNEKVAVTRATREALDAAGFPATPIIIGATEGSVRGTVELAVQAKDAGADYALVLAPSYYKTQIDKEAIVGYFTAVADASPLPVIVYNHPAVVAGIDLDSDVLIRLAQHPNVVGTEFTCGNTGKLSRVAQATFAQTPFGQGSGYMAFGGMCDFTLQTLISGGSGVIAGGANVMPKVCVRVWNLYTDGKREEAEALQKILSRGDWALTKAAIAGTKYAIHAHYGYGGFPRRPLKKLNQATAAAIQEGIREVMDVEKSL
ncbi:hypothetical protein RJ55_05461 [Drechmeria coniospora]|nr:hypothetical protein RJ55_05461 [Drechmeria coniospora]